MYPAVVVAVVVGVVVIVVAVTVLCSDYFCYQTTFPSSWCQVCDDPGCWI